MGNTKHPILNKLFLSLQIIIKISYKAKLLQTLSYQFKYIENWTDKFLRISFLFYFYCHSIINYQKSSFKLKQKNEKHLKIHDNF
jgi:hypothetical protein